MKWGISRDFPPLYFKTGFIKTPMLILHACTIYLNISYEHPKSKSERENHLEIIKKNIPVSQVLWFVKWLEFWLSDKWWEFIADSKQKCINRIVGDTRIEVLWFGQKSLRIYFFLHLKSEKSAAFEHKRRIPRKPETENFCCFMAPPRSSNST